MTKLVVHLLGGYRVEVDGKPVHNFGTDKARALLAYLVVEAARPHRREALAGLLWPEQPEVAARTNLRQAMARLRRALSTKHYTSLRRAAAPSNLNSVSNLLPAHKSFMPTSWRSGSSLCNQSAPCMRAVPCNRPGQQPLPSSLSPARTS